MKKMKKGTVIKDIPDNLISDYEKLGWEIIKETEEPVKKEIEETESKVPFKPVKK